MCVTLSTLVPVSVAGEGRLASHRPLGPCFSFLHAHRVLFSSTTTSGVAVHIFPYVDVVIKATSNPSTRLYPISLVRQSTHLAFWTLFSRPSSPLPLRCRIQQFSHHGPEQPSRTTIQTHPTRPIFFLLLHHVLHLLLIRLTQQRLPTPLRNGSSTLPTLPISPLPRPLRSRDPVVRHGAQDIQERERTMGRRRGGRDQPTCFLVPDGQTTVQDARRGHLPVERVGARPTQHGETAIHRLAYGFPFVRIPHPIPLPCTHLTPHRQRTLDPQIKTQSRTSPSPNSQPTPTPLLIHLDPNKPTPSLPLRRPQRHARLPRFTRIRAHLPRRRPSPPQRPKRQSFPARQSEFPVPPHPSEQHPQLRRALGRTAPQP